MKKLGRDVEPKATWRNAYGHWKTQAGSTVRIDRQGEELTVTILELPNNQYRMKVGDVSVAHLKPTGPNTMHSNSAYTYAKAADIKLAPHDHGTCDLVISADGQTITGKRSLAQYYDGSTTWDAGEMTSDITWKRIPD